MIWISLLKEALEVDLALIGHLPEDFGGVPVVDALRQAAAHIDALAHVLQWIVCHPVIPECRLRSKTHLAFCCSGFSTISVGGSFNFCPAPRAQMLTPVNATTKPEV